MKTINKIAYFDEGSDGKTLHIPRDAERAVLDADCIDRLIAAGFERIAVEEGNAHFTLKNGCLSDRDGNLLLAEKGATMSEDSGIKSICDFSFPCYEIRKILHIPEGVERLGLDVFRGKIERVTLPASLNFIHEGAFRHTLGIEEIAVSAGNACFCVDNGCLIEEKSKTLLYVCGNTAVIPDGVRRIGRLVFLDHRFRKIVIPASVEKIALQNFFYLASGSEGERPHFIRATHARIEAVKDSFAENFLRVRGLPVCTGRSA